MTRPTAEPLGIGEGIAAIVATTALGIAQPLFDLLSGSSDFFVAHRSSPIELVGFALLVYLGPPIAISSFWLLVARVPAASRPTLGLIVAILVALLLQPALKALIAWGSVALAGGLLLGTLVFWGLERFRPLRSFLSVLAPLSVAVPLIFLFASPVALLVRPAAVADLDVQVANPVPVVMIVLDELPVTSLLGPDREIDAELLPSFAALASASHWFRNATSVSPATVQAVPALLSGRYPHGKEAAIAAEYPESLFTLLGSRYELDVFETQTRLCPARLCPQANEEGSRGLAALLSDAAIVYLHIVVPEDLTGALPSISGTWAGFGGPGPVVTGSTADLHIYANDRRQIVERFLGGLGVSTQPSLSFLHVMLPHIPWVYLPSGKEYWGSLQSSAYAEGVDLDGVWTTDEWLIARGYQRHLLQLAYVDRLLGRLLDRLRETGLWDRALVIVTADHGLSFRPGARGRVMTEHTLADIMAVPLFVRTPGQAEGSTSQRNVELVDVLPTMADIFGIDLPFAVDGASAFEDGPERADKRIGERPDAMRTVSPSAIEAAYETLAWKQAMFAGGLFGLGPHPELVDVSVADLPVGAPSGLQVRLDQRDHFTDVRLDGSFIPAQIFGRVRGVASDARPPLAIAVNGTVRAVTRIFGESPDLRFAVVVPEASFVDGENTVEVFEVSGELPSLALQPARESAVPSYVIERDVEGRPVRLLGSDGSTCVLDAEVDGGFYRVGTGVTGWARDEAASAPFVVVMTFVGERLVHTTSASQAPPREAPVADDAAFQTSGFRFLLPAALLESGEDLRVFAVVGEYGRELEELAAETMPP